VRPQAAHAREVVLELGELDLELAFGEFAWPAKMSRIVTVRSTTGIPSACSRLRSWRGAELVVAGDEVRVRRLGAALTSSSLPSPR
jgi:hypothetical protein